MRGGGRADDAWSEFIYSYQLMVANVPCRLPPGASRRPCRRPADESVSCIRDERRAAHQRSHTEPAQWIWRAAANFKEWCCDGGGISFDYAAASRRRRRLNDTSADIGSAAHLQSGASPPPLLLWLCRRRRSGPLCLLHSRIICDVPHEPTSCSVRVHFKDVFRLKFNSAFRIL